MRKLSGSYYTPADVAEFFWHIFFSRNEINSTRDALRLIDEYAFIEPSVGAGALFFALVKKLLLLGVSPSQLQEMRVDMVDLNQKALDFVSLQVRRMEDRWGTKFDGLNLIREDFRNYQLRAKPSLPIFFGNPPFVTNDRGASRWKNLFADFVEISLRLGKGRGFLHYILPLSIAFSRDYRGLRYAFKALKMELSIASFDNIPDTLFKSGKPKHTNSNRANSQRCTILTAVPADEVRVSATKLHRWSRGERARILSSVPEFFDVTDYAFDDQFPRPASAFAAHYLSDSSISRRFSSLLSNASGPRLLVASVARNYIGFRDEVDSSCHCLHFANKEDFLTGLGILSSDLFFQYWLTVGDGFHLTKTNILNFPISESVEKQIRGQVHEIDAFWKKRHRFEKVKFNSGKKTRSYDFSSVSPRPVQVWR